MASDFEKVLEKAKYSALPLPRGKSGPTTVFAFNDGHLFIVRNQHSCLPDPPLSVTEDPAVDLLSFNKQFSFEMKGIIGFLAKIFGKATAKTELEIKKVSNATVQMGGLAHYTIETGAFVDYMAAKTPSSSCLQDILDPDHLTIVAALRANSFTYTFSNSSGATVKFTGPEAEGLFKVDASVDVQVSSDGKIVVTSPTYVGFVAWDGKTVAKEVAKRQRPALASAGIKPTLRQFGKASASTIAAVEYALTPGNILERRLASMGIDPDRSKGERTSQSRRRR